MNCHLLTLLMSPVEHMVLLVLILLLFVTKVNTHNRFTAVLDFVRDYLGEPAPER